MQDKITVGLNDVAQNLEAFKWHTANLMLKVITRIYNYESLECESADEALYEADKCILDILEILGLTEDYEEYVIKLAEDTKSPRKEVKPIVLDMETDEAEQGENS